MQNYCTHVQTHSIPTPLSSIFAHFWQNLQNTVHMDSPHFPIKCTGNLHQIWRNGKKVWKICAKLNLRLVYKYILWILSIRTAVQLAAWFFPSEPQYSWRLDSFHQNRSTVGGLILSIRTAVQWAARFLYIRTAVQWAARFLSIRTAVQWAAK